MVILLPTFQLRPHFSSFLGGRRPHREGQGAEVNSEGRKKAEGACWSETCSGAWPGAPSQENLAFVLFPSVGRARPRPGRVCGRERRNSRGRPGHQSRGPRTLVTCSLIASGAFSEGHPSHNAAAGAAWHVPMPGRVPDTPQYWWPRVDSGRGEAWPEQSSFQAKSLLPGLITWTL